MQLVAEKSLNGDKVMVPRRPIGPGGKYSTYYTTKLIQHKSTGARSHLCMDAVPFRDTKYMQFSEEFITHTKYV